MSSEEIRNLRRKLKKARESGKLKTISDCCCSLAAYLSEEEDYEEALKLYNESLMCCEKLGNKEAVAVAHRMIAEVCLHLARFKEAFENVAVFLKYAIDEGNKVQEQRALVLKGHVYFTQAEYLLDAKPEETKKIEQFLELSMDFYRKSFAICNSELNGVTERERLQMKARLLQNKSLVLSRQNKLDYAQAHLIRAIKICAKARLNDTGHICYLSMGDLYLKKNELEKALHVYDKALELSRSNYKKKDSLVSKAKTFILMENYQKAKSILKSAFKLKADDEIKKLLKNVTLVIRLENNLCSTPDTEQKIRKDLYKKLGDCYSSLKSHKKAIKCYLNMLGCAQKANVNKNELIKCYTLLCKAFINDKQYDKALFYSHQEVESLSKLNPSKASTSYFRIAKLHELNGSEFEEIHSAYLQAINKAQQFKNFKVLVKCLKRLIGIGETYDKPDLVSKSKKELENLKKEENDSFSSCDSGNDSESGMSSDSKSIGEQSSDIKDLLSDSDFENEEYDRPKERCKRTKFTIKRNEKGETELHVAAIKGNYRRVKQLIDQGHPVNVRDTAGWTPLHEACNHGYVDIVNILLDSGANINDKGGPSCDGTTPLHDAAINGQLEVIDTLIKRGASTLVLNDASETPLQCLLAWKRNSALDENEDAMFETIVQALKSPLDAEDIKRHLKPNRNFADKKSNLKSGTSCDQYVWDIHEKGFKPKKPSAVSEYKETIGLLRRKRQTQGRDSRESCSENSEDDCYGNSRKRKKSASDEYREAIEELRFKPKKMLSSTSKMKAKPALISEHEYVENCIMDNDEEVEFEKNDEFTPKNEEVELDQKKIKSLPSSFKKPSLEEELKSKPWLKSIPMDLLEDSFELSDKQNENENFPKSSFPEAETSTQMSIPDVCISVKLCNETIQVHVSQSEMDKLKISWLIGEISKKHPGLRNSDNYIYIKTKDDILGESDSLASLADQELECVVTKWKALPLSERYEKVCTITSHPDISSEVRRFGFKHTVQPLVLDVLKKSCKSRILTLSNLKLSSLTLIPICKAIKYETFIQRLDLSNNYFGDKGIEIIVKIFEKCIIEELDVSGCNITSTGVYHFSDALNSMNELSKNGLEVLNLSSNPITDDAIVAINNITEQLSNLRSLNIDRCELDTLISVNNSTGLVVIQGDKFESLHRSSGTDS